MIRPIRLHGTTDASGDAVINSGVKVIGLLHAVEWTDGDLANGVDFVLSQVRDNDAANITLLSVDDANDDAVYYPRYPLVKSDGSAIADQFDRAFINGSFRLVIDDGGNAKSGGATVYVEV